jgi:glucose-1-phosphate thymidylyltransferase
VELDAPVGPGEGILAAADALAGDPFLLHPPDGLMLSGTGTLRRALAARDCDATVFFRPQTEAEPVPLRARQRSVLLAEAPPGEQFELDGVQALGPAVVDALRAAEPGQRGILDAVDRLAGEGRRVRAGIVEGWWRYSGTAQALLAANHEMLDRLEAGTEPGRVERSRVEGRVRVHPTAVLDGATVRGPVLIGPGARITDAYVGPYTSIGENAVVDNAEIEGSIVLAGAQVRNLGVRIEESILGRDSIVERDFQLPRAVRLLIGTGSRVALS